MPMRIAASLIVIAGTLLASGSAAAELVHSSVYRDHPVRGTTPAEIWRYMNAHPIIDPDDGPAYANLTHDHDLTFALRTRSGACRVEDLAFRWRFVLTLPKAVDYPRMSAATKAMWDTFRAALRRHEETHRAIFLDCGAAFVPAAARLTGPAGCRGMERKVRRYVEGQYTACMARQRAFEKQDRPRILSQPFIRAATGR